MTTSHDLPSDDILSVSDLAAELDTFESTEKPVTHYMEPLVTDGILPMPSPLQRRYSSKSYHVALHPFLPFHSQAYMATIGRLPGAYERATGETIWDAYKRMPTGGTPVAFTAISAATGGGKSVGACALIAHIVLTVKASCAYVVETIEAAEEVRQHLEILLPGQVACYTSLHRHNAAPEKVRDYAAANVVAGATFTEHQFLAARVVVCTHERWKAELLSGRDMGVRLCRGKPRTLVVVDEEPQLQVTYVQQPEDVAHLLSVLSDVTLTTEARSFGFVTHHAAAPSLKLILDRMIDIKSNANVPQLYTADLVTASDLEYISQLTRDELTERLRGNSKVDASSHADRLMSTVDFLKAASQGRVFYSKSEGGAFHAYAFKLPVQPRHIVLDGTADLNGWNAVGSHMAIVESEPANYARLRLFAVRPPKEFRGRMRSTGILRDNYKARSYMHWLHEFIVANTDPGEHVLVYAKKALLNFAIHKTAEFDTSGGSDRLLSHFGGRVVHWANFGKGRGVNKWKHCTAYFRCGDFHLAKAAAVSKLGSVASRVFSASDLRNFSSSSTRSADLRLVLETHLAVSNKQDTMRTAPRRLDEDGKCAAGRAYMLDCDLGLLTKYKARMFPGAADYTLIGYEKAVNGGDGEDGASTRVATLLLTTDKTRLTVSDLERECGLQAENVARTLRTSAVVDALASRGWTETTRRELGLPGKGKVFVRTV